MCWYVSRFFLRWGPRRLCRGRPSAKRLSSTRSWTITENLLRVGRLGMDRHAENLREVLFHAVFERSRDVVDLRNRQLAFHRAVARNQDVLFDLSHAHVMTVDQLVVFHRQSIQKTFDG